MDMLSVISSQLLAIRDALLKEKESFSFFGRTTVKLNKNLGIFVTYNPYYKGRYELPNNLKYLLRPVALMIPEYKLITEILLYAEGFTKAGV